MKTKSNLKILLAVVMLLITMLICNVNYIQAANVESKETQGEEKTKTTTAIPEKTKTTVKSESDTQKAEAQRILNLIPNTITLDVTEMQVVKDYYENDHGQGVFGDELVNKLKTILKDENINMSQYLEEGLNLSCGGTMENRDAKTKMFKGQIIIEYFNGEVSDMQTLAKKDINIKCKNTDDYNVSDKQYIETELKNIDTSKKVYEYELSYNSNDYSEIINDFNANLEKKFNDKNIQCIFYYSGQAFFENNDYVCAIHLYKNNIYYATITTGIKGKLKVAVPDNIHNKDTDTNKKVLDNEPKTGGLDYTILASIVSLISLGGLVSLKFKK